MDAARSTLLVALQMPAAVATPLANYLGMFRPKKRALQPDRLERLMAELLPMLAEGYVVRDGVRRACSLANWTEALQTVCQARAEGQLTLPLESHGYLLTIASRIAEKAGAQAERARSKAEAASESKTAGDARVAFLARMSRIAGDLELGLITPEKAEEQRAIARREYGQ